ncbi:Putative peptide/nitrate transporter [Glycine soja]|uniref:Putative peptide/nitrate transporter n=1 Tax=Glycine soja TaxID=3848 RepID=A0A0B2SBF4_GLYSO|nr:Putative peptide/nitrate transporter [Glycine soja]
MSVVLWVPLYDRIIVSIIRTFTGKERGLSMLQRMGIRLFISVLCMLSAAVVEIMHLQLTKELDLGYKHVAVPLSVLQQIPQYFFLGAAVVFTFVGQLEFLYDQSPDTMKTLGNECCERLAFFGIATNLVTYLTTKVHEGNVSAPRNVSIWLGTSYLTPLIGAALGDGYWGRYWTIAVFSVVYFIGMCTLTLSASLPALKPAECLGSVCPSATPAQYAVFYFGLYVIALGIGGIKSCVPSFGAGQFDDTDPKGRVKKGSFFNWYYFSINLGAIVSSSIVVWIQDNAGWGLGFGIPTLLIVLSMASFFIGTPLYRFQKPGGSPVTRMCQVLCTSVRKWNFVIPEDSSLLYEMSDKRSAIKGSHKLLHSDDLRCLDRAATVSDYESKSGDYSNPWRLCPVTQVEELKIFICMFPMWATGAVFSAVYTQMSTLFVEQGTVMNTNIGSFEIPPASLATFDVLSVGLQETLILLMNLLLYHSVYFGKRLLFAFVGLLEFFYDQSPDTMKTLGTALSPLYFALGNYLSSFILTMVTYFTTHGGKLGWIPDNLNKGHLDYFFLLLAGLSFLSMLVYIVAAKRYKQTKTS